MKIRIDVTLDVDPEAWELEYGTALEDLREDVREYMIHEMRECAAGEAAVRSIRINH